MKTTTLSLALFMLAFGTFTGGHSRLKPINNEPVNPRQVTPCDDLGHGIRCIAL